MNYQCWVSRLLYRLLFLLDYFLLRLFFEQLSILQLNGRELLTHAGKISHEKALKKSGEEFEKYKFAQREIEKEQSLKEIEEDIKKIVKG